MKEKIIAVALSSDSFGTRALPLPVPTSYNSS